MNYDLHLTRNSEPGHAIFRLYRWSPYCISLGTNQNYDSINLSKAKQDAIDIVIRPTGGRAILHSEEITYSVVYPLNGSLSPRQLYHEINLALKAGLANYHPAFEQIELEKIQPDFGSFYNQKVSELCFAVPAKSELKFNGKKLVGSAQRKMNKAVLQHGSVLCGDYHKKIIDYLNCTDEEIEQINNEINFTTIDIKSVTNEFIDYKKLCESLKSGMEVYFNMKFENVDANVDNNILSY